MATNPVGFGNVREKGIPFISSILYLRHCKTQKYLGFECVLNIIFFSWHQNYSFILVFERSYQEQIVKILFAAFATFQMLSQRGCLKRQHGRSV